MRCERCRACDGSGYQTLEGVWWMFRICYTCFGRGLIYRDCLGIIRADPLHTEQPREEGE